METITIKQAKELGLKTYSHSDWEEKFKESNKTEFFETEEEARKAYWDSLDGETTQGEEEFLQNCFIVENEDLEHQGKEVRMEIKTLEQAKELGLDIWLYPNNDWSHRDGNGYWHFFRNGKELLPEIKKVETISYTNGDWEYRDTEGYLHLFRNGEELLPEIKKLETISYANSDWRYKDTNNIWHKVKAITKGLTPLN